MVKRVSPQEAKDLIDQQGYVYVDVRSIPEFDAGHPTGAYNVPLNQMGPAGMAPNPEFMAVMEKSVSEGREAGPRMPGRRAIAAGGGHARAGGLHERRRSAGRLPGPRRARLAAGGPAGLDGLARRSHVRGPEASDDVTAPAAYLVTGATGVLGGAVVDVLLAEGARVAAPHRSRGRAGGASRESRGRSALPGPGGHEPARRGRALREPGAPPLWAASMAWPRSRAPTRAPGRWNRRRSTNGARCSTRTWRRRSLPAAPCCRTCCGRAAAS